MASSLRLILIAIVLLAAPFAAAAQPGTAGQPAERPSFETRANTALARYTQAHFACDEAGKRAAAEELNALAAEARAQLSTVRTAGQFSRITLTQANKDLADVTLAIEAARATPPANCPPRRPAQPPSPPAAPAPRTTSPDAGAVASNQAPTEPESQRLSGRGSQAVARMELASEACDLEEMQRQMAVLDELASQARLRISAARTAGSYGSASMSELEDDLNWVQSWRDIGRRILNRRRENCRIDPNRPPTPADPPRTPPVDIFDPNFRDPLTDNARDAAEDYEEARQACDDQAMQSARVRLEELLRMAEEIAAVGATVRDTGRRTTRLKEIADTRVRDIEALIGGLRGVPVNCPSETAPPPPAEQPPVPRQRAIRGLFGMLGAGWLKESETDLGFASLGGGYRFGDHFGIEGEAAIGIVDQEHEALGFRDSFGIEFDLAAFATVYLPVGENADLFARAGYGHTQFGFSAEGPGFSFEESTGDDSFRYGLGGQIFFDEANGVRVTWTRWDEFEEDGIDADVFVISYVRRFGGTG